MLRTVKMTMTNATRVAQLKRNGEQQIRSNAADIQVQQTLRGNMKHRLTILEGTNQKFVPLRRNTQQPWTLSG